MPFEVVDKWKILQELIDGRSAPGSPAFEQQKLKIQVAASGDLENALKDLRDSMEKNSRSSEKLARQVFWLDVVLAIATVVVAVTAVIQLWY